MTQAGQSTVERPTAARPRDDGASGTRFRRVRRRPPRPPDRNVLIGYGPVTPYALSGPAILMVSALLVFPVVYAMWGSLFNTETFGGDATFVGLENYRNLLGDSDFRWAASRSVIFMLGSMISGLSLALLFSFALNKASRRLRFLRGLTIMPYLVSSVAAAVMFRLLFGSEFGQVNQTLAVFGIHDLAWFSTPHLAMITIIVAQVWTDLPLAILLILGGLQTIDPELLDAASVDGANAWHRAFRISLPMIIPQLFIATVWFSYGTLTSLGVVLALTGGGPSGATTTLPVALYESAFVDFERYEAMAIVVIMLLLNALLTIVYWRVSRRYDVAA